MPALLVPELICADIERSLEFYCGVLGFSVRYARTEDRFAYLEREGAELMLEEPLTLDRLYPREALVFPYGRGVNFQIDVRDVDALHAAVIDAGCSLLLEMEERWYRRAADRLGVRQFAVPDPDGYVLRFAQMIGIRAVAR